ncbi:MAG: hypothetical protein DI551_05650 [Micavibrio aeruginosavorus]|uniref:Uncharacterized protein n=1 Tax=Micavibrio aeruginosavorus TaxID=349221 RepID=A0A2W5PUP6_9BACT|nr:MAG: hypothetical protein DI551_05650 [Micavibrio aeruginosavorus]
MSEKFIERGQMADISLTNASLKTGGAGALIFAWVESNMNFIIGLLTLFYLILQIVVIWPKALSELKRHWFNLIGLFDRRGR